MNFSKLCRSCMKDLKVEELEFHENIADIFTFCTNIQVSEDIALPKSFCSHCVIQIQSCYNYIRQAQEVNNTLKSLILESRPEITSDDTKLESSLDTKDGIKVEIELMTNNGISDTEYDNRDVACYTADIQQLPQKRKRGRPRKYASTDNYFCKTTKKEIKRIEQMCKNLDKSKHYVDEKIISDKVPKIVQSVETMLECQEQKTQNQRAAKEKAKQMWLTEDTSGDGKCPVCLKIFPPSSRETWIKYHLKRCREREKDAKNGKIMYKASKKRKIDTEKLKTCPKCFKAFLSNTWLKRHLDREHAGVLQTFPCLFCPSTFDSYNKLIYHRKTHEENNKFQCNICNKKFRMRKHLFVHMITHSDERPYTCDKCLMSFKMKHVLINHIKLHDNMKAHLCSVCGKSFGAKSTLETHLMIHTGEKPFACPQCDYRCKRRICLRRHMLLHQSELKFPCKYCQKQFRYPTTLYRHQRLHTGEKPFKCPHCPQAFVDGWKRKMHLMRGHEYTLESIPRMNREGQSVID